MCRYFRRIDISLDGTWGWCIPRYSLRIGSIAKYVILGVLAIEKLNLLYFYKNIIDRRITTRGADKGVREEVKQAMRRQAARDGIDPLDELLQKFIINEKAAILHSLIIQ